MCVFVHVHSCSCAHLATVLYPYNTIHSTATHIPIYTLKTITHLVSMKKLINNDVFEVEEIFGSETNDGWIYYHSSILDDGQMDVLCNIRHLSFSLFSICYDNVWLLGYLFTADHPSFSPSEPFLCELLSMEVFLGWPHTTIETAASNRPNTIPSFPLIVYLYYIHIICNRSYSDACVYS